MLEGHKISNKKIYDLKIKNMEIALGDKVLLRNEVSHKLVAKYTGHFKIESVEDRNIIIISGKKKTTTSPQG